MNYSLDDDQLKARDRLVAYMVSINDVNGAVYAHALQNISSAHGVYWLRREPKQLYDEAVDYLKACENRLKQCAERVVKAHTVAPTRDEVERRELYRTGLMRDYQQSQSRGWSTD